MQMREMIIVQSIDQNGNTVSFTSSLDDPSLANLNSNAPLIDQIDLLFSNMNHMNQPMVQLSHQGVSQNIPPNPFLSPNSNNNQNNTSNILNPPVTILNQQPNSILQPNRQVQDSQLLPPHFQNRNQILQQSQMYQNPFDRPIISSQDVRVNTTQPPLQPFNPFLTNAIEPTVESTLINSEVCVHFNPSVAEPTRKELLRTVEKRVERGVFKFNDLDQQIHKVVIDQRE